MPGIRFFPVGFGFFPQIVCAKKVEVKGWLDTSTYKFLCRILALANSLLKDLFLASP